MVGALSPPIVTALSAANATADLFNMAISAVIRIWTCGDSGYLRWVN
jgi:hypothetical protein